MEKEKDKPLKILPTNDLLFQHIFGKVGNEEITKNFYILRKIDTKVASFLRR